MDPTRYRYPLDWVPIRPPYSYRLDQPEFIEFWVSAALYNTCVRAGKIISNHNYNDGDKPYYR